jgi:hypothetical protein
MLVRESPIMFALMARADPIPELKRLAASALAKRISGWASVYDAAALLGTQRARVVDIRSGRLTRFSLETLLRYLVRAGARVELRVIDAGMRAERGAQLVDDQGE